MVFGIITESVIVPVFVIEVRADVNVPVPEIVPELMIPPAKLLWMMPELEMVPGLKIVPELERVPKLEIEAALL